MLTRSTFSWFELRCLLSGTLQSYLFSSRVALSVSASSGAACRSTRCSHFLPVECRWHRLAASTQTKQREPPPLSVVEIEPISSRRGAAHLGCGLITLELRGFAARKGTRKEGRRGALQDPVAHDAPQDAQPGERSLHPGKLWGTPRVAWSHDILRAPILHDSLHAPIEVCPSTGFGAHFVLCGRNDLFTRQRRRRGFRLNAKDGGERDSG